MVLLVLVGGVYKPPKHENFGLEVKSLFPGTLNDRATWDLKWRQEGPFSTVLPFKVPCCAAIQGPWGQNTGRTFSSFWGLKTPQPK